MARAELGVYINGTADPEILATAYSITGPGITRISSISELKFRGALPRGFIIAGGEGSIRVVVQEMYKRGEIGPVGLLGGGTQNVLFNELGKRQTMTLEEFCDTPSDKFPAELLFHPGQTEDIRFINQFAIGAFEQRNGEINSRLHFLPRGYKPAIVRITAGVIATFSLSRRIDMFSVVPNIGNVHAFPKQDPFGPEITHAWIEGWDAPLKLAKTLIYWWQNKVPPPSVLKTESGLSFSISSHAKKAWVDGDTIPNPNKGEFEIKRTKTPFPVVALKI